VICVGARYYVVTTLWVNNLFRISRMKQELGFSGFTVINKVTYIDNGDECYHLVW